MVNIYTTSFNVEEQWILLTWCIYSFHMCVRIHSNYFCIKHEKVFLVPDMQGTFCQELFLNILSVRDFRRVPQSGWELLFKGQEFLSHENGTVRLSRKVCKKLSILAALQPKKRSSHLFGEFMFQTRVAAECISCNTGLLFCEGGRGALHAYISHKFFGLKTA